MQLNFSTPCAFDATTLAASFGFAGAMEPAAAKSVTVPVELAGVLLTGTYEEVLAAVPSKPWQAAMVFLGNCGGEDAFVRSLQQKAGCALVGGSAAIDPVTGEKALIAGRKQAAVYLISDESYDVSVVSCNIHTEEGVCRVEMESPRVFASIDGEDPLVWFKARRQERGLADTDFEHFTLSDSLGVNAHLSVADGKLVSGRNLEEKMHLRYVKPDAADAQMQAFYDDENAIICGCAGLKGILKNPIESKGTGLFLFGEVCTVDGISKFGNLMLSKLCVKRK